MSETPLVCERLHVDLCCGLGGWQAPFKEDDSWCSLGVDVRRDVAPDVQADVRELPLSNCEPTLVTASPPCQEYSTAWNRWKPLPERDPDTSVWDACVAAVDALEPEWWIIENVAGAQHFHGDADTSCFPYCFWGTYPPFSARDIPAKGDTSVPADERKSVADTSEAATIPYTVANALKRAVEQQQTLPGYA